MATQISSFYHQYAMDYAVISEDRLTVTLPSEKEASVNYEVRCEHTANGIEAVSCQCRGFSRWRHCKHLDIVQEWQTAHYVAPKVTEIEKGRWYIINSDTQIWLNEDDKWEVAGPTTRAIEIVEAHLAVETAEEVVATPVVEAPVTYWDKDQCCRCYVTTRQPVDPVAQQAKLQKQYREACKEHYVMNEEVRLKLLALSPPPCKGTTDLSQKGNLNTSRAFSMWR